MPEFANRKRDGINDGVQLNDWWVSDFTLQEIQKLKLRQGQMVDKRSQIFDWQYKIPTMRQVLIRLLQYKQEKPSRKSGLLIEIKSQIEFQPVLISTSLTRILS